MINYQEIEFIVKVPKEEIELYLEDMRHITQKRGIQQIIHSEPASYNID